jgi:thiamine-phosphate pyrophosphorylase
LLAFPNPLLCLITDELQEPGEVERKTADACDAGCRLIQLRNRILGPRSLLAHAERMREITTTRGSLLAINAGCEVPAAIGPDAIHLPGAGPSAGTQRAAFGESIGIGRSVHSSKEVERFAPERPDYFQFGPVFATASKARYGAPQGVGRLREIAERIASSGGGAKLVAVGGIDADNLAGAIDNGADGIAVIGAVMSAADAAEATNELLNALRLARANR